MKTLLFLLVPYFMFAQIPTPDSLVLLDGRSTPCLITSIDDSKIYFEYYNSVQELIIIKAVERVYMENYGYVYEAGKGFKFDKDILNVFTENRRDSIMEIMELSKELKKISLTPPQIIAETDAQEITEKPEKPEIFSWIKSKKYNKWSFGILYVPYNSGKIYNVSSGSSYPTDPSIYYSIESEINMEAQLAYGITQNFRFTLDAGYSSTLNKSRYEYHYVYDSYDNNQGYENTIGLKMLDFTLGLKYYFKNFTPQNVNIYASLGVGKQIAFAQNKYEDLFLDPVPGIIKQDNVEEFAEKINSPWHFNIGFGAEYFFNNSLSLIANIRVLYSSSTGKFNSRYITDYQTTTRFEEYTQRDFSTRIGLGVNFYF